MMESTGKIRVCVIGAGPAGMAVLHHVKRLQAELSPGTQADFEVTCFDKQSDWGGQWKLTWRTGTNEFGELVHSSMYNHLWANLPKEANVELPDYTFEEHFGKPIGSFPPRKIIFDYLEGRWNKLQLRQWITFGHSVVSVVFNGSQNTFTVIAKNLIKDELLSPIEFDYVVNCSGHFSGPNVPNFPGFDTFPGIIMHSHDVRNFGIIKGQRLLLVGAGLSGEDLALQTLKFGASNVIISYRSAPLCMNFPSGIQQRPLLTKVDGKKIIFKDGTDAEVDAIILCTGYLHHYPHISDNLRLKSGKDSFPPNLYKGMVWLKGGNCKLFYLGAQRTGYTIALLDVQARWVVRRMAGLIDMLDHKNATVYAEEERKRSKEIRGLHKVFDFLADYMKELAQESDYGFDVDTRQLFHASWDAKIADLKTYRDKSYPSHYTGNRA